MYASVCPIVPLSQWRMRMLYICFSRKFSCITSQATGPGPKGKHYLTNCASGMIFLFKNFVEMEPAEHIISVRGFI